MVALAARTEPRGIFSPFFTSLGAASYAVYAIHQPMHAFLEAVAGRFGVNIGMTADVALIVMTIPLCLLIDHIYDSPVRNYLTRMLLKRSRPVLAMPVKL